jgi:hypothetical protein
VLVIIGLIVGGILVGPDMIAAAAVRAQISQIEKYHTAVHTFQSKYGGLPGDLNTGLASQFGFIARGQYAGGGDGNGLIEGISCSAASCNNGALTFGETTLFWVDLSQAGLIDQSFSAATATTTPSVSGAANFQQYFPTAKLGSGNYVDVWSGGPFFFGSGGHNGLNYFSIGIPTCIGCSATSKINGVVGISVAQAYMIDQKIDDGSPGTGWVTANSNFLENVGSSWAGDNPGVSITASPTTCYVRPAIFLGPSEYSMSQNHGSGINCVLSFQFQ